MVLQKMIPSLDPIASGGKDDNNNNNYNYNKTEHPPIFEEWQNEETRLLQRFYHSL